MINFTEKQIQEAMQQDAIYSNNLRDRDDRLRKDCFVRGRLAEIFFRNLFQDHCFEILKNIPNYGEDIDLQISGIYLQNQMIFFNRPINIEIKTSLIPYENFNILQCGDVKIYKNSNIIENDIKWDICIQVYFNELKQYWENFIRNSDENLIYERYKHLNFDCYWITRDKVIYYSNSIHNPNDKIWTFNNF